MTNCTVSGNTAGSFIGGGICNDSGIVTMTNCTVSGNEAYGDGGGIYNDDTLTMTNCTVSGNQAKGGIGSVGGSSQRPPVDADGGGIYTRGGADTLRLNYCTITGNTADGSGGGIYNDNDTVSLHCTIVYGNSPNNHGGDAIMSDAYSIVDNPDPLLGPLQNNGGPTETHALLVGSPAIDACIDCTVYIDQRINGLQLETDQRGYGRPVDGDYDGVAYCDVGAYEKQPPVGGIVEPVDPLELGATSAESSAGASSINVVIGMVVLFAAFLVWQVRRKSGIGG